MNSPKGRSTRLGTELLAYVAKHQWPFPHHRVPSHSRSAWPSSVATPSATSFCQIEAKRRSFVASD